MNNPFATTADYSSPMNTTHRLDFYPDYNGSTTYNYDDLHLYTTEIPVNATHNSS